MRPCISAVIMTLNEEKNIGNALRSVAPWVDEMIVVDMYSEDRTAEIARSLGARVVMHERLGFADPARKFAEEQVTGDWVFVLDADEIVPLELSQELRRIAENDSADICSISRLNYFGGFPLLHSGWGPEQDRHTRFYRRGAIEYESVMHARYLPKEGRRVLKLSYHPGIAIIHFNFLNAAHQLARLNSYTDIEASQRFEQSRKVRVADFLLRPLLEFANRYFRLQGFRDGWAGLYYCSLMLIYRLATAMKLLELQRVGSAAVVREKYQTIAEEYLASYRSPLNIR
jgi:(heptosyl)LPS beta-1,4-glucosyltransferase